MGIIDNIRSVAKTVQQIDNIELYRQILDLQAEITDLVEENSELKRTVAELREQAKIASDLVPDEDCYWLPPRSVYQDSDGPFCTNC